MIREGEVPVNRKKIIARALAVLIALALVLPYLLSTILRGY